MGMCDQGVRGLGLGQPGQVESRQEVPDVELRNEVLDSGRVA